MPMHFTMNSELSSVWQTYLAKMFKADGVKLHLQVLTSEDLSYQVPHPHTAYVHIALLRRARLVS
jgi:hypothetical protein